MFTVTFSSRFPKESTSKQYIGDFRKKDAVYEYKLMSFLNHCPWGEVAGIVALRDGFERKEKIIRLFLSKYILPIFTLYTSQMYTWQIKL